MLEGDYSQRDRSGSGQNGRYGSYPFCRDALATQSSLLQVPTRYPPAITVYIQRYLEEDSRVNIRYESCDEGTNSHF